MCYRISNTTRQSNSKRQIAYYASDNALFCTMSYGRWDARRCTQIRVRNWCAIGMQLVRDFSAKILSEIVQKNQPKNFLGWLHNNVAAVRVHGGNRSLLCDGAFSASDYFLGAAGCSFAAFLFFVVAYHVPTPTHTIIAAST